MAEDEAKKDGEAAASENKEVGDTASSDSSAKAAVDLADKAGSSLASVVAASSLTTAARRIADAVRSTGSGAVVIVEDRAVAVSDVIRTDVIAALDGLEGILAAVDDALAPPSTPPPPPPPPAEGQVAVDEEVEPEPEPEPLSPLDVAKQLGDFVALFRSTFTVTPVEVRADRVALIAEVAGQLARPVPSTRQAAAPAAISVVLPSMASLQNSALLTRAKDLMIRGQRARLAVTLLESQIEPKTADLSQARTYRADLVAKRDAAQIAGETAKVATLNQQIVAAVADIASKASDPVLLSRRAAAEGAKTLLTAFEAGLAILTKASGSGTSNLMQAALREHILTTAPGAAQLWLDVTATGGDAVRKDSPLGWNSEASFLGAVQAVYLLVAADGKVAAGGTEESFGHKTFDFENFFDGVTTTSRRGSQWAYETGEILAVGLVLLVALVVLVKVLGV